MACFKNYYRLKVSLIIFVLFSSERLLELNTLPILLKYKHELNVFTYQV